MAFYRLCILTWKCILSLQKGFPYLHCKHKKAVLPYTKQRLFCIYLLSEKCLENNENPHILGSTFEKEPKFPIWIWARSVVTEDLCISWLLKDVSGNEWVVSDPLLVDKRSDQTAPSELALISHQFQQKGWEQRTWRWGLWKMAEAHSHCGGGGKAACVVDWKNSISRLQYCTLQKKKYPAER